MKRRIVLTSAAALLAAPVALADGNYTTDNNNVAISDNVYDGSLGSMNALSVNVAGEGVLTDIDVILDISHTWLGDLTIKLQAPNNQVVFLVSRAGFVEPADDGSGCCGFSSDLLLGTAYEFDDAAGASSESGFGPGAATVHSSGFNQTHGLNSLNGINANGTWTVFVGDGAAGDVGIFDGFTLQITSIVPAPGALALLGAAGLVSRRRRRN